MLFTFISLQYSQDSFIARPKRSLNPRLCRICNTVVEATTNPQLALKTNLTDSCGGGSPSSCNKRVSLVSKPCNKRVLTGLCLSWRSRRVQIGVSPRPHGRGGDIGHRSHRGGRRSSRGSPEPQLPNLSLTRKPFRSTKKTFVRLEEAPAQSLLKANHIKIGWVSCRVRRKTEINRCYRCLGFGHMAVNCREPDRSRCCWRCGEEGHAAGSCSRKPWC